MSVPESGMVIALFAGLLLASISRTAFAASPDAVCIWKGRNAGRLRVQVKSSKCDGLACEDALGGTRIFGTNIANGLKLLGPDVQFASRCVIPADVVLDEARLLTTSRGGQRIANLRRDNSCVVIVATKTNLHPQESLHPDVDLATAGSFIHASMNEVLQGIRPSRTIVHRLVEVPKAYWSSAFMTGNVSNMYSFVPRHSVASTLTGTGAVLCYHGNAWHMSQSKDLITALKKLHGEGLVKTILMYSGRESATRLRKAGLPVIGFEYPGVDKLFAALSRCELGLVPNIDGNLTITSPTRAWPWPVVSLPHKSSVNGGRAFVMAQVGLPFVATPEYEAAELLGGAGIETDAVFALTPAQWHSNIARLLRSVPTREDMSSRLRSYAEAKYDIKEEAKRVEGSILRAVRRRSAAQTCARGS
eukprot:CAMPEP_0206033574 /NCGR_PEP_ID=MMETSP1466-20131121/745_1 /ASSEMBLY_ACC=CAM_ASM_001126 /TAXON_ID=44452 /ORGANISM="Pavlova gyrans, Strain CCMP608" /LENGTH=417 /DNA_ID=CAMNT_0053407787 /DNA_START=452 /DNA_END=1705 /DNA_ORIENTATION=-